MIVAKMKHRKHKKIPAAPAPALATASDSEPKEMYVYSKEGNTI